MKTLTRTSVDNRAQHAGLRTVFLLFGLCCSIVAFGYSEERAGNYVPAEPGEVVEIAIALDTSGSMGGLLDAARFGFWDIIGQLNQLEPAPTLRLALLTYGTCRADWKSAWVNVELDFTQDLDLVSERLFAESCDGGGEYVGRLLEIALSDLSWSTSEDALKLIFIVGNEAADQDPMVNLREVTDIALEEGIEIHAVFCGKPSHKYAASWKRLSELSGTEFSSIDYDIGSVVRNTPFDETLAKMAEAIYATYLPLGDHGLDQMAGIEVRHARALAQSHTVAAARSKPMLSNAQPAGWELIASLDTGQVSLMSLDPSMLPKEMKSMNITAQREHVDKMRSQRNAVRKELQRVSLERQDYISAQLHERGFDAKRTFAYVIYNLILNSRDEHLFWTTNGVDPD